MNDQPLKTPVPRKKWAYLWDWIQLVGSLTAIVAALFWLLFSPSKHSQHSESVVEQDSAIEIVDNRTIRIVADSPLGQRLQRLDIIPTSSTAPLLQVTGRVIASRRPASDPSKPSFWQFSSGTLLDSFTAWQKSKLEASFAATQLDQVKELGVAREDALVRSIERLEKLVKSGSESEKTLAAERTLLLQTRIEDRKSVFDAQVALKTAERQINTQLLQLQLFGLNPEMLDDAPTDLDIVSAEVPESMVSQVEIGQECSAEFFGIPNVVFDGKVSSLSPVLNAEQRTLRVLFAVKDPKDLLRPGMFAKIGIGTDPREIIRIPADCIIHIGAHDIVLVAKSRDEGLKWLELSIQNVVVQEQVNSQVEVRSGLEKGQTVIGKNAVLMKPIVTRALEINSKHLP